MLQPQSLECNVLVSHLVFFVFPFSLENPTQHLSAYVHVNDGVSSRRHDVSHHEVRNFSCV